MKTNQDLKRYLEFKMKKLFAEIETPSKNEVLTRYQRQRNNERVFDYNDLLNKWERLNDIEKTKAFNKKLKETTL